MSELEDRLRRCERTIKICQWVIVIVLTVVAVYQAISPICRGAR
jgi:hypothetical protein